MDGWNLLTGLCPELLPLHIPLDLLTDRQLGRPETPHNTPPESTSMSRSIHTSSIIHAAHLLLLLPPPHGWVDVHASLPRRDCLMVGWMDGCASLVPPTYLWQISVRSAPVNLSVCAARYSSCTSFDTGDLRSVAWGYGEGRRRREQQPQGEEGTGRPSVECERDSDRQEGRWVGGGGTAILSLLEDAEAGLVVVGHGDDAMRGGVVGVMAGTSYQVPASCF